MPTPPNPPLNFESIARRAMLSCQQWRTWSQREPTDSYTQRHGFEIAALFEKQATIFAAMHRNRIEWRSIACQVAPPERKTP